MARFTAQAAFALYTGIATIPVWSRHTAGRVRPTRSGKRQLSVAVHRIAITQLQPDGLGKAYHDKRSAPTDLNPGLARTLRLSSPRRPMTSDLPS